MIVMPEIALEPDISGVWSVGGTFVMTSNPTNIASTNTTKSPTSDSSILCFSRGLTRALMHDAALMDDGRSYNHLWCSSMTSAFPGESRSQP